MNKIISNLTIIAAASEYFDKQTGAAWKIRSSITNMAVWAANGYIAALKSGSAERIWNTATVLATIRVWVRDCNESSLVLDLTPGAVRKTLGLERVVDVHAEACRIARQKCIQSRQALRFKEYYDAAANALDEQRRNREENVEHICNLLSDNTFELSPEVLDHARAFCHTELPEDVGDSDLYDDQAVERQSDTLAETVGNALESMYDVCDHALSAAITTDKITRLTAYNKAIMRMMEVAGVDTKRLAERRAKLEAQIEAQISTMNATVADMNAQIDAQLAEMQAATEQAAPVEATKPKRTRIPKAA